MLKKSASGVLASLRGSTYRSVCLVSSLAAALLNGLFEHPAETFFCCGKMVFSQPVSSGPAPKTLIESLASGTLRGTIA